MHPAAQIGPARLGHEMKMVPHQDKCQSHHVESLGRNFQKFQKRNLVPRIDENSLPRITTPEKMIDGAFKLQSQRTRHILVWIPKTEMSNV